MSLDVGVAAFVEGHRASLLKALRGPLSVALLDRVYSLVAQPTALLRLLARVGEAVERDRTETHLARSAVEHEPVDPRLGAGRRDLQIETAAVRVHARPLLARHLQRREPPA